LKSTLDFEITTKHGIRVDARGVPLVNRPANSLHTNNPSNAVDAGSRTPDPTLLRLIDQLARIAGLARPCHLDVVHFTLAGAPCDQTITATALSPVSLLIIDPLGRRVGFDPASKTVVNDLNSDAFYTGPDTEPQVIDVHLTVPGRYTLTAVGNGTGPYSITLSRLTEDATVISEATATGTAIPGGVATLVADVPQTVQIKVNQEQRDDGQNATEPIDIDGNRPITVAILANPNFDPTTQIVRKSLRFGHSGTEDSLKSCDSDTDDKLGHKLVCKFSTREAKFLAGDTQGILNGSILNGTPIEGVDWVVLIQEGVHAKE
jgi:hypothetical protein